MNPVLKKFLDDSKQGEALRLCYLGNEGFLLGYHGFTFVMDPYLSDYTDENCCTSLVKWKRRYAPPVTGEELDFVDLITLSHGHYDHSDPYTIRDVRSKNKKVRFVFPAALEEKEGEYHLDPSCVIPAHADTPIQVGPLKIIPIPAAHEEIHRDEHGDCLELGYLYEIGPYRIFHAGDMCPYAGLQERLGKLDVALMPVNGRSHYKRYTLDIIGNFTAEEAMGIALKAETKLFVPLHFDLYDVNSVTPESILEAQKKVAPSLNVHICKPLEVLTYLN